MEALSYFKPFVQFGVNLSSADASAIKELALERRPLCTLELARRAVLVVRNR